MKNNNPFATLCLLDVIGLLLFCLVGCCSSCGSNKDKHESKSTEQVPVEMPNGDVIMFDKIV